MVNFLQKALMRKMIESQGKNLPVELRETLVSAADKNPELLIQIGQEIAAATKQGKDQMTAAKEVMEAHRAELETLFKKS